MITLRQLLVENPDVARHEGELYVYSSGRRIGIFSIFKDAKTNRWVSAVSSKGNLKTSDTELNKILEYEGIDLNDDEYDVTDVHPNLLSVFVGLQRLPKLKGAFEYRNAREDIPINARVWKTRDGKQHLVSFWSRSESYLKHKNNIDKALELLKVDPEKCLYEFIEQPDYWFSYKQRNSPHDQTLPPDAADEFIKKMMKIQHISPAAKKVLLKKAGADKIQARADDLGTTVASIKAAMGLDENQVINEDPDDIKMTDGTYLNYSERQYVTAVVCLGYVSAAPDATKKMGWFGVDPNRKKFFINGRFINRPGNVNNHFNVKDIYYKFHGINPEDAFSEEDGDDDSEIYTRICHMRLFVYKKRFYATFWETRRECKKVLPEIIKCLDFFTKGRAKDTLFQFEENSMDQFLTFDKAWGSKLKRSQSKQEAALRQALHLMPAAQKAAVLKKMGAMKPNELQKAADKLGMTPIELRQALGLDVAENSQGNVSFSDHGDPEIPYEAKPRPHVSFSYGTVFERFTRRRTRLA